MRAADQTLSGLEYPNCYGLVLYKTIHKSKQHKGESHLVQGLVPSVCEISSRMYRADYLPKQKPNHGNVSSCLHSSLQKHSFNTFSEFLFCCYMAFRCTTHELDVRIENWWRIKLCNLGQHL